MLNMSDRKQVIDLSKEIKTLDKIRREMDKYFMDFPDGEFVEGIRHAYSYINSAIEILHDEQILLILKSIDED